MRSRGHNATRQKMKRKYRQSASALNNKEPVQPRTRRVVFVTAPGTEILDLVGPLQVFVRASEMFVRENPGSSPIYSVEVVTTSPRRSFVANCGLGITAHKTFRELRGKIDTLLVAGGSAIENDEINLQVVRWLKKIAVRSRRVGSVCTGAMLLARAGLLDGRRATTHWNWCEVLIGRAPRADVDPDPIFVRDENIYTSAGVTAGMDLPSPWWRKITVQNSRCRSRAISCSIYGAPAANRNSAPRYRCS